MRRYDIAVVGLGAFGSAATYQLAKAGARVLGIDRFSPPHDRGSSHGETRITRMAIGEGVEYTPLALRSRTLWRQIERETSDLPRHASALFNQCGCLTIYGPNGTVPLHEVETYFENITRAAEEYKIEHKRFARGDDIRATYPQFAVAKDDKAFLDLWGGYLRPEECIRAQLRLARRRHSARLKFGVRVKRIRPGSGGVVLEADKGRAYLADRVLITAGPWLPQFLPSYLRRHFSVTRQPLHWFEIRSHPERFSAENSPVFIWDVSGRKIPHSRRKPKSVLYGFPLVNGAEKGLKVSHENIGRIVDPDRMSRKVTRDEIDYAYETYVRPFLPDVGPRSLGGEVCLYTNVEKARFVIDTHPDTPHVLFASPCSGHGFKHSAALGEALAQQLRGHAPSYVDLEPFTLKRLAALIAAK